MDNPYCLTRASAAALLLLCAGSLRADEPEIQPGVKIDKASVLYMASPTSVDWNNDGAKDLIVGQELYGNILLFLNQGTDLNPAFNGGVKIESGGAPISVSST